jgi:hypothetical protein
MHTYQTVEFVKEKVKETCKIEGGGDSVEEIGRGGERE